MEAQIQNMSERLAATQARATTAEDALRVVLAENQVLQHLEFRPGGVGVGDAGARPLAEGLKRNKSLLHLSLACNAVDVGVTRLEVRRPQAKFEKIGV